LPPHIFINPSLPFLFWPQATNQEYISTIGETMLLMEIHSTNFYWHVPQHIEIYPKVARP